YALGSAGTYSGVAWHSNRPGGVHATPFATEGGARPRQLAAATADPHASRDQRAAALHDPATACATSCTNAIAGASFNLGWHGLATWETPSVAIANAPATLSARLQIAGVTRPDTQPVTVSLTSTSPQGGFSSSPIGPWTSALDIQ